MPELSRLKSKRNADGANATTTTVVMPSRSGQIQLALADDGRIQPQPFLKWVGGKTQLIKQFSRFFPGKIKRYYEPFIGGGAVFFYLKHRFPEMKASLRDNNAELINTYEAVRDHAEGLMKQLDRHLAVYLREGESYYYTIRGQHSLPAQEVVERAARMIFLNKTCFNGLWRVNAKGEFNVPVGSHAKPSLYNRDNILATSAALQGVDLAVQDFKDTLVEARSGDFMYIDPPYVPVSATASFTGYTKENFGLADQQDLARLATEASGRGVKLMLSNSDTPLVRTLYAAFTVHTVQARRAVNSDAEKRGAINEVLVMNPP